jgi:hypothetical protein
MSTVQLGSLLNATRDRYAKALKPFALSGQIEVGSNAVSVWELLRSQNGKQFRVLVQCQDGTVRDWIGRGGVHNSEQDGEVQGIGAPMANRALLNLSFWTATYDSDINIGNGKTSKKVNTGTGYGYRTLKAEYVIAIHAGGCEYLTAFGLELCKAANVC